MKKNRVLKQLLEELKKVPIVQIACEKCGVSRKSFYEWKRKDKKFEKLVEEAMSEGEAFINEMSESQLLQLIKEGNFPSIRFWLNHRHPKFKEKVEITTKLTDESLSPEQEQIVREALRLASSKDDGIKNDNQNQNA